MKWIIRIVGFTCMLTSGHVIFAAPQRVAVGYYLNTSNNLAPLSYTSPNEGATWSLSAALPLPADVAANGIQNSKLQGVSCSSTGIRCAAIGFYFNNRNNLTPLSYTTANGGTTWSLSATLFLPSDVAANGIQNTELQGVSCDSAGTRCVAVGFYRSTSNNINPLSYTSVNGGATWSLSATLPLPVDVAGNGGQNSELQGVTCDSARTQCSAVGFYLNSSNNLVPLSYVTSNGGVNWSLSAAFLFPGDMAANGIQNTKLFSAD